MKEQDKWYYKGEEVTELPKNTFGFVYKISYTNGKFYIGKKQVQTTETKPLRKDGKRRENSELVSKRVKLTESELSERKSSDKRKSKIVQFEKVTTINDSWKKYKGSSKLTTNLTIDKKEIMYFSSNKRTLTYLENYLLYKCHGPCNKMCLNENIGGQFYDNVLDGWIKEPKLNIKENKDG